MKYNIASKLENSKNYTPIRAAESNSMTFILGTRCSDGVVLVADKKSECSRLLRI